MQGPAGVADGEPPSGAVPGAAALHLKLLSVLVREPCRLHRRRGQRLPGCAGSGATRLVQRVLCTLLAVLIALPATQAAWAAAAPAVALISRQRPPRNRDGALPRNKAQRYEVDGELVSDTLGRRLLNVEPNTSSPFVASLPADLSSLRAWRYAYDDAGDLVGTSDARGCGTNYHYDATGRLLAEDYSPCTEGHADYSVPDLATGVGAEVWNRYDAMDPQVASIAGLPPSSGSFLGLLASTVDRGQKTILAYDARGRVVGTARRVARPGVPTADPATRYAPRWYVQTTGLDMADRPLVTSTGARAPELLGADNASEVRLAYSKRGTVKAVGSSYGSLVARVTREADGAAREILYGDVASTTTWRAYDERRRIVAVQTYRAAPGAWSTPPPDYEPPPGVASGTLQMLLEDTAITYDEAGNPVAIDDYRNPDDWPVGAKPASRSMQYDDLYRLKRIEYAYPEEETWVSPYAAENAGSTAGPTPSPQVAFAGRIAYQTFGYDWLGNTKTSDDDARGFYDRSLGTITNGTAAAGPHQLRAAANDASGARAGSLAARYDATGQLTDLLVVRNGPCLPAGARCSQRFAYAWDEVGRLAQARRWDVAATTQMGDPLPATPPAADLRYAYDGQNDRVLKTAVDTWGAERHTAYVFDSLELRRTRWLEDDYDDTAHTEAVYLYAGSVRLGRVAYAPGMPMLGGALTHVLIELPDTLGSTATVIDRTTGELVERAGYQAYGQTESDYRPDRWNNFREDYRFTGKEEDIEVGLVYFGHRYLAPALGRWISADPLTIHGLGADPNPYAYVHGRVLRAVDPTGLDEATQTCLPQEDPQQQVTHAQFTSAGPPSTPWSPATSQPGQLPSTLGSRAAALTATVWNGGIGLAQGVAAIGAQLKGDARTVPTDYGQALEVTPEFASHLARLDSFKMAVPPQEAARASLLGRIGAVLLLWGFPGPASTRVAAAESKAPAIVEGMQAAKVAGSGIRVTEAGITRIEGHLGRLGALEEPANAAMLDRLRAGQTSVQDINFYMHELKESAVMGRTGGYGTYDGARAAHLETLQWQKTPYAPGYESQLYHPDVIRMFQDMFNPAAWPK